MIDYLGRNIILRVKHAGIDLDYIKLAMAKEDYSEHIKKFTELSKNRFTFASIDLIQDTAGITLKLEGYKRFLEQYPKFKPNIVLIQILCLGDSNSIDCKEIEKDIDKLEEEIKLVFGSKVIHIIKTNKFTMTERLALFSVSNSLLYLQMREGNTIVFYFFI